MGSKVLTPPELEQRRRPGQRPRFPRRGQAISDVLDRVPLQALVDRGRPPPVPAQSGRVILGRRVPLPAHAFSEAPSMGPHRSACGRPPRAAGRRQENAGARLRIPPPAEYDPRRFRRFNVVSQIVVLSILLAAAPGDVQARRPDGNFIVPGTLGGIVYRTVGGRDLELDACLIPDTKIRPGVLVIHGGGWTSGSRIARVGQWLEALARAGLHSFPVDY